MVLPHGALATYSSTHNICSIVDWPFSVKKDDSQVICVIGLQKIKAFFTTLIVLTSNKVIFVYLGRQENLQLPKKFIYCS